MKKYVLGVLSPQAAEPLERHVTECEECSATIANLEADDDTLLNALRQPASDPYWDESPLRAAVAELQAMDPPLAVGTPPRAMETPQRLGEYQILELLGDGGMGAVYKALHTKLKRVVALKVLPPGLVQDAAAIARFEREMEAVGKLDHPHIVRAFDAGEANGRHFLAMELIQGSDLSRLAAAVGPLPIADACEIVRQAALGIAHAAEHGLVHRDLKPSNLLVARTGQVKILDLGLALLQDAPAAGELTRSGQVMGTLDYMAPEQGGDSHQVDIRADLYGLGATLFRLLAGRAPLADGRHDTALKKLMALATAVPPPLSTLRPEVPPELSALVARLLSKSPDDRPSTPQELAAALAGWTAGADLAALVARGAAASAAAPVAGAPSISPFKPAGTLQTLPHVGGAAAAPQLVGEPPHTPSRTALIAAGFAGLILLLGVIFIIRDQNGNVIARVEAPAGATIEVQPAAEARPGPMPLPTKEQPDKPRLAPAATPPLQGAINLPTIAVGDPLSDATLVARPAAIAGVKSWTIESRVHRGKILCLRYSPDGKWLATAGIDGTLRIEDVERGVLHRVIVGAVPAGLWAGSQLHGGLAWSADSSQIATHAPDGTLRIYDRDAGRLLSIVGQETPKRGILAWSASGAYLISAKNEEGQIRVWDVAARECVRTLPVSVDGQPIRRPLLALSPRGDSLAYLRVGATPTLVAMDIATGEIQSEIQLAADSKMNWLGALSWSPDGRHIACQLEDRLLVWDIESKQLIRDVPRKWHHPDDRRLFLPDQLAWSPKGDRLAFRSESDAFSILRLADERPGDPIQLPGRGSSGDNPEAVAWRPDGKVVAIATRARRRINYDPDSGRVLEIMNLAEGIHASTGHFQESPDGSKFLAGTGFGRLQVFDLPGLSHVRSVEASGNQRMLQWHGDHQFVHGLYYSDRSVRFFAATTGARVDNWKRTTLANFHFSPDQRHVALWEATFGIYNASSSFEPVIVFPDVRASQGTAAWTTDGRRVAFLGGDELLVVDVEARRELARRKMPREATAVWSPDGKKLATSRRGGADHGIRIWSGDDLTPLAPLLGHQQEITALHWTADGRIVSSSRDQTLRTWNPETGRVVHNVSATPLDQFWRDGSIGVAWKLDEAKARFIDVASGAVIAQMCFLHDDRHVVVSAEGHYKGSPNVEEDLVYIVHTDAGEQLTLSPAEFSQRYNWQNDPGRVQLVKGAD